MKKTYKLILFVLIFFSCSQDTHTIAIGTVKDTVVGQPIDSVEIMLKRKTTSDWFGFGTGYRNVGLTYSNIYGEFYIDDHYTKQEDDDFLLYELLIGKAGYRSKSFELEENETNEFDVSLTPQPTELHTSVSGKVLDKMTELFLASVKVSLLRETDFTNGHEAVVVVFTNSHGEYFIEDYYTRKQNENFPDYNILWEKRGYNSRSWHLVATNRHNEYNSTFLIPE